MHTTESANLEVFKKPTKLKQSSIPLVIKKSTIIRWCQWRTTYGYFELVLEPVEVELSISHVHQLFAPTRQLRDDPTGLHGNSTH